MSSEKGLAIETRALCKTYGQGTNAVEALRGVDLQVERGECLAVTGSSGSGKTTLMHILGGLDRSSVGVACVDGRDLAGMSRRDLTLHRRRAVGFVFQAFHLIPTLTAAENVEMPLRYAGVPHRERQRRVAERLDRVGLSQRGSHLPAALSGGEQQRVALARALVGSPSLVLADEPTGNLDSTNSAEVVQMLLDLTTDGEVTVLVVTHNEEVANVVHRRVQMRDGRLV